MGKQRSYNYIINFYLDIIYSSKTLISRMVVTEPKVHDGNEEISYPVKEALVFKLGKRLEVWRYFTHIFVHASPLHLLVNCIGQIAFGK